MSKYFKFIGYVGLVIFSIGALADFVTLCMLTKQIMELKKSGIDDVTSNFLLGICVFSFIVMLVFGPASFLLSISYGNHLEQASQLSKSSSKRFFSEKPFPDKERKTSKIVVQGQNLTQTVSKDRMSSVEAKPTSHPFSKQTDIVLQPYEVTMDETQIYFQSKCFGLSNLYNLAKSEDSVFFFVGENLVQIEKCSPTELENIYNAIAFNDGFIESQEKRALIAESGKGQTLTENEIEELLQMSVEDLRVCLEN